MLKHISLTVVVVVVSLCLSVQRVGAQPPPAAAPQAKPVTQEEAAALGKQIDDAARSGDLMPMLYAIDDEEIFTRATTGVTLKPETRGKIKARSKVALELAGSIQAQVRAGGSYRLVRVTKAADGKPILLFRLVNTQGVNYHELHLSRDKAGRVRIADVLIFLLGETTTQHMRGNLMAMLVGDPSVKMTKAQQDLAAATPTLSQVRQLLSAGRYDDALQLYGSIPLAVQEMKSAALLGVTILSKLGNYETYSGALDQYRKRFPDAADIELIAIEALFLRDDYDGAIEAVDRLDKRIGGDTYLNLYRGNAQFAKGDIDAARETLNKALAAHPDVPGIHLALIGVELKAQNFDQVANLMSAATRDAGVRWSDLQNAPAFSEFIKSPAYEKWKSAAAKPAAKPAS